MTDPKHLLSQLKKFGQIFSDGEGGETLIRLSTIRHEILDGISCNKTSIDTTFGPDIVPEPQMIVPRPWKEKR
ncbi:MAG TPA: hypothetical protein VEL11_05420 [Candidatus Bathyarchaeia archaeon]|nr:hypothetical protein [Candidatus Bathyarchaeia archaeon]